MRRKQSKLDTALLFIVAFLGVALAAWCLRVLFTRRPPSIRLNGTVRVFVHQYWQRPSVMDRGLSATENQGAADVIVRRGAHGLLFVDATGTPVVQGELVFRAAAMSSRWQPLQLAGTSGAYDITRELWAFDASTGVDRTPELGNAIQARAGRNAVDNAAIMTTVVLGQTRL